MISNVWARTAASILGLGAISWAMVQEEHQSIEIHKFNEPVEVQIRESAPPIAALQDSTYVWVSSIGKKIWSRKASQTVNLVAGIPVHPRFAPAEDRFIVEEPLLFTTKTTSIKKERRAPRVVGQLRPKPLREIANELGLSERMTQRLELNPKAREELEKLKNYKSTTLTAAAENLVTEVVGPSIAQKPVDEPPEILTNLSLSGDIEIDGGLAYIGGRDTFHVFREHFGVPQEEGFVKISEGFYKINVASTEGSVVAILFDENGEAKGEGSILLSSLQSEGVQNGKATAPAIKIKPLQPGAKAKVISSYSFGPHEFAVEKSVVSFSGQEDLFEVDGTDFRVEELDKGSSFQLMAGAADHWGTLVLAHTGKEKKVELFSNSRMDALLDFAEVPLSKRPNVAVVFGKVTEGGLAVEGSKVELASQDVKPIYFNTLMIPDKSMDATGPNGLYAFVDVSPGIHVARAVKAEENFPPEVFVADVNNVSNIAIEKGTKEWVPFTVYDPMRGDEPVSSEVQIVGEASSVGVDGESLYPLQRNDSLMWLESFPEGNYTPSRIAKPRKSESLLIPTVGTNWVNRLKETLANEPTAESAIVGYVSGGGDLDTYQVFLGTDAKSTDHEVVYFDSSGERSETAQPEGGFAIFNVEQGLQTVVIVPNAPLKASTHLVIADSDAVSVVQHFY